MIIRILVKHFPPFKDDGSSVSWHIKHRYSTEMKMKSKIVNNAFDLIFSLPTIFTQVPLGIELKDENKTDEMCVILESIQKYIPAITQSRTVQLPNGESIECQETEMWETLFGGDQLTVDRAKGAIDIRYTHESEAERLEGIVPVIEDWHARMALLKVSSSYMFSVYHDSTCR